MTGVSHEYFQLINNRSQAVPVFLMSSSILPIVAIASIGRFNPCHQLYYTKVFDRHTTQQFNKFINDQQRYKIEITLYLYTSTVSSHNIT